MTSEPKTFFLFKFFISIVLILIFWCSSLGKCKFERTKLTLFSSPLALINVNFLGIILRLTVWLLKTLHANFLLNKKNFFACLSQRFIISMSKKSVPLKVTRAIVTCDSQVKRNINIFLLLLASSSYLWAQTSLNIKFT